MSEYQYHEWQAVDRVLTPEEQAAVGGLAWGWFGVDARARFDLQSPPGRAGAEPEADRQTQIAERS